MRRFVFIAPVAVFVGLVGLLGFLLAQDGRDPSLVPSQFIDEPVPEFVLAALKGRPADNGFSTADLRDGVRVVNIFASWCVPCLAEHPLVTRLAEDGYEIYGINHRDEPVNAARWLARHGDPYTRIGADSDARVSLEWGVTGVPETFIVDQTGMIRYKHSGPLTPDLIEDEVLPRLRELSK